VAAAGAALAVGRLGLGALLTFLSLSGDFRRGGSFTSYQSDASALCSFSPSIIAKSNRVTAR
jgi:hypothetical protein